MADTPWIVTINYSSTCKEIAGLAPNAHAADVFAKAFSAMQTLVDNEALDSRLPCGCAYGAARLPEKRIRT